MNVELQEGYLAQSTCAVSFDLKLLLLVINPCKQTVHWQIYEPFFSNNTIPENEQWVLAEAFLLPKEVSRCLVSCLARQILG